MSQAVLRNFFPRRHHAPEFNLLNMSQAVLRNFFPRRHPAREFDVLNMSQAVSRNRPRPSCADLALRLSDPNTTRRSSPP